MSCDANEPKKVFSMDESNSTLSKITRHFFTWRYMQSHLEYCIGHRSTYFGSIWAGELNCKPPWADLWARILTFIHGKRKCETKNTVRNNENSKGLIERTKAETKSIIPVLCNPLQPHRLNGCALLLDGNDQFVEEAIKLLARHSWGELHRS